MRRYIVMLLLLSAFGCILEPMEQDLGTELEKMNLNQNDVPGTELFESKSGFNDDALTVFAGNATLANKRGAAGWRGTHRMVFLLKKDNVTVKTIDVSLSSYKDSSLLEQVMDDVEALLKAEGSSLLEKNEFGARSIMAKKVLESPSATLEKYTICFYKRNIVVNLNLIGEKGFVSANETKEYARILEKRISG